MVDTFANSGRITSIDSSTTPGEKTEMYKTLVYEMYVNAFITVEVHEVRLTDGSKVYDIIVNNKTAGASVDIAGFANEKTAFDYCDKVAIAMKV